MVALFSQAAMTTVPWALRGVGETDTTIGYRKFQSIRDKSIRRSNWLTWLLSISISALNQFKEKKSRSKGVPNGVYQGILAL